MHSSIQWKLNIQIFLLPLHCIPPIKKTQINDKQLKLNRSKQKVETLPAESHGEGLNIAISNLISKWVSLRSLHDDEPVLIVTPLKQIRYPAQLSHLRAGREETGRRRRRKMTAKKRCHQIPDEASWHCRFEGKDLRFAFCLKDKNNDDLVK